ncbi:hypothetical protein [Aeromonas phage 13AhydR10PP]|nr:hypothetical protein [Aeromonas phage 13AhydR10PP]
MTMTKQIKAQAEAAQQCLTILRDAGLIGDNLLTKLADTRTAILEVLGKMYQVCNKGEEATGESLERVRNTITQLYGRAKWTDHDAMMDMVEGALEHFIQEAKETVAEVATVYCKSVDSLSTYRFKADADDSEFAEYFAADYRWHTGSITVGEWRDGLERGFAVLTNEHGCEITEEAPIKPAKVCPELGPECRGCPDCGAVMGDATYQEMFGEEAPLKPAKVELTEEIKAVARNSIKGLTIRVAELTKGIEEMPEDLGKEWLIVSALGTIAYEPFQGALRPALRMEKAIGFKGMLDAHAAAPQDVQVMRRIDALKAVLHSSQEALSKMQEVMGGEA